MDLRSQEFLKLFSKNKLDERSRELEPLVRLYIPNSKTAWVLNSYEIRKTFILFKALGFKDSIRLHGVGQSPIRPFIERINTSVREIEYLADGDEVMVDQNFEAKYPLDVYHTYCFMADTMVFTNEDVSKSVWAQHYERDIAKKNELLNKDNKLTL